MENLDSFYHHFKELHEISVLEIFSFVRISNHELIPSPDGLPGKVEIKCNLSEIDSKIPGLKSMILYALRHLHNELSNLNYICHQVSSEKESYWLYSRYPISQADPEFLEDNIIV